MIENIKAWVRTAKNVWTVKKTPGECQWVHRIQTFTSNQKRHNK